MVKRGEFAAIKGWAPSYVTKLGHQKRLVLSEDGKLIDVEATEALLASTSSVERAGLVEHHARERDRKGVESAIVASAPLAMPPSPGSFKGADDDTYRTFNRARAEKEEHLAALAKMQRRKQENELGEVTVFRGVVERLGAMVSRRLEQLPARLVPMIRTAEDSVKAEDLMAGELRRLLAELAAEARAAIPTPTAAE
jgi:hypothetical protein